jgi:hypothetical protein
MANKNVSEYRNPNKLAVLSVQGKYISSRKISLGSHDNIFVCFLPAAHVLYYNWCYFHSVQT